MSDLTKQANTGAAGTDEISITFTPYKDGITDHMNIDPDLKMEPGDLIIDLGEGSEKPTDDLYGNLRGRGHINSSYCYLMQETNDGTIIQSQNNGMIMRGTNFIVVKTAHLNRDNLEDLEDSPDFENKRQVLDMIKSLIEASANNDANLGTAQPPRNG